MKKTVVKGIFKVLVVTIPCVLSFFFGENYRQQEVEKQINQVGVVNVDNGDIASSINELIKYIQSIEDDKQQLEDENQELNEKVDDLEKRLSAYEQENKSSETAEKSSSNQQQTLEVVSENATELKDLPEVSAEDYELMTPFTDSYGNEYATGYKFDASRNAEAVFGLKGSYTTFSAIVVCGQDTGPGADMKVSVYKNDDELLETISDVNKTTETLVIGPYDITDARNITIKTSNEGVYDCGFCYLVKAYVE